MRFGTTWRADGLLREGVILSHWRGQRWKRCRHGACYLWRHLYDAWFGNVRLPDQPPLTPTAISRSDARQAINKRSTNAMRPRFKGTTMKAEFMLLAIYNKLRLNLKKVCSAIAMSVKTA
jgi:hypothetical protein